MAQGGPISILPWDELTGTGRKSLSHSIKVPTRLPAVVSPALEWASLLEDEARPEAEPGDGWRKSLDGTAFLSPVPEAQPRNASWDSVSCPGVIFC